MWAMWARKSLTKEGAGMAVVAVRTRTRRYVDETRVYARTNRAESGGDLSRRSLARAVEQACRQHGAAPSRVVSVAVIDEAARRREWNLPEPPQYTVVVEWRDGHVEDADEITVSAATPAGAVSRAKAQFRKTIVRKYPSCRICSAWVMNPDRLDMIGS